MLSTVWSVVRCIRYWQKNFFSTYSVRNNVHILQQSWGGGDGQFIFRSLSHKLISSPVKMVLRRRQSFLRNGGWMVNLCGGLGSLVAVKDAFVHLLVWIGLLGGSLVRSNKLPIDRPSEWMEFWCVPSQMNKIVWTGEYKNALAYGSPFDLLKVTSTTWRMRYCQIVIPDKRIAT